MVNTDNVRVTAGKLSYKPLLKLLVNKEMNTTELSKLAGISSSTMTEIRAHRSVTLETILKICIALECAIEDVVEIEFEVEPIEGESNGEASDTQDEQEEVKEDD